MKKRTVITTEKREIWIVRQPADNWPEGEADVSGSDSSISSLAVLEEQSSRQTNTSREELFNDDSDKGAE